MWMEWVEFWQVEKGELEVKVGKQKTGEGKSRQAVLSKVRWVLGRAWRVRELPAVVGDKLPQVVWVRLRGLQCLCVYWSRAHQCAKERANGQNRKTWNSVPSRDRSSLSVSLAPAESSAPLAVGLAAAGTSFLTLASFLLWLLKRLRKKGKGVWEHTPKMFLKNVFFFSLMSHVLSCTFKQ